MLEPEIRLRQSIKEGNLLVVKRLLKRFPEILENIDPVNGWSSLHYAAYNGRYLICVHLISLGHDKTEVLKTFKHDTSVHLALMNGHEQTTHLLLQHFPQLLDSKGDQGLTPLHISSMKDYFKCVEMLLAIGADLKSVDQDGNNSLHLAMKYGSLQTIKILIINGVDKDLKNKNGLKPIDIASSFQVEKYYQKIINSKDDPSLVQFPSNDDNNNVSTPGSVASSTTSPSRPIIGRIHSNSLPPLPSVTTARRASNASSINTRSPIPRSSISLGFNGSNSNSYTFSPTSISFNSPQINSQMNTLNIKPPPPLQPINSYTQSASSSPVLTSPISGLGFNSVLLPTNNSSNGTGSGLITNTIVEEGQTSGLVNSTSLSSFPSMTSLSSGKNTPEKNRTRSSTNQSITLPTLSKSRSNSSSKLKNSQPGKISPPNSSGNLSRTSSSSTSNADQDHNNSLLEKKDSGSTVLSGFFDNEAVRTKLNNKLENVTMEIRNRSNSAVNGVKRGGSGLLDIPIASLRRKE